MNVKNEAESIERSIKSIAPIVERAVISIDSLDAQDTRNAAEKACAKWNVPVEFLEHVWEDNFSKMRNGVLEYAEAGGGDWILMIDGHEYLYPGHAQKLKTVAENAGPEITFISFMMKMIDENGRWDHSFAQGKLWRMGKAVRYERAMHNQVSETVVPPQARVGFTDIWIMHDRPLENAKIRNIQRNRLLPERLEPEALNGDEDALFHMLEHWGVRLEPDKFFELFKLFDEKTTKLTPDCQYQVHLRASRMYAKRAIDAQETTEMTGWWSKCFGELMNCDLLSSERNEHIMQRGRCLFHLKEYESAIRHFKLAMSYELPATQSFAEHSGYTWEPFACIANSYQKMKRIEDAWMFYHHALQRGGSVWENIANIEKETMETDPWEKDGEKPRLYVIDKLGQFSNDLICALSSIYSVRVTQTPNLACVAGADAIWCEWMDENSIFISLMPRSDKVIFTRLHGYEAIEADFAKHINWQNLDFLIAVSKQMLDFLEERFGAISCKKFVIPNAIDLRRFNFAIRERGRNIAWLSFLNNKKNVNILIQAAKTFPDYIFHVAGQWQDIRLERFFWESIEKRGLKNLIFSGPINDADGWLEDKNYLLNGSLWESFSFALHEACAKGIKPLVHEWVGVEEFFPPDLCWGTMDQLKGLLEGPYESRRYQKIANVYDVVKIAGRLDVAIQSIRKQKLECAAAAV